MVDVIIMCTTVGALWLLVGFHLGYRRARRLAMYEAWARGALEGCVFATKRALAAAESAVGHDGMVAVAREMVARRSGEGGPLN